MILDGKSVPVVWRFSIRKMVVRQVVRCCMLHHVRVLCGRSVRRVEVHVVWWRGAQWNAGR